MRNKVITVVLFSILFLITTPSIEQNLPFNTFADFSEKQNLYIVVIDNISPDMQKIVLDGVSFWNSYGFFENIFWFYRFIYTNETIEQIIYDLMIEYPEQSDRTHSFLLIHNRSLWEAHAWTYNSDWFGWSEIESTNLDIAVIKDGHVTNPRLISHELGHSLGLPDLYYEGGTEDRSLMGRGLEEDLSGFSKWILNLGVQIGEFEPGTYTSTIGNSFTNGKYFLDHRIINGIEKLILYKIYSLEFPILYISEIEIGESMNLEGMSIRFSDEGFSIGYSFENVVLRIILFLFLSLYMVYYNAFLYDLFTNYRITDLRPFD